MTVVPVTLRLKFDISMVAHGNGKEDVCGINTIYKIFLRVKLTYYQCIYHNMCEVTIRTYKK